MATADVSDAHPDCDDDRSIYAESEIVLCCEICGEDLATYVGVRVTLSQLVGDSYSDHIHVADIDL